MLHPHQVRPVLLLDMEIRAAGGADLAAVAALLAANGLPVADLPPDLADFYVATDAAGLAGTAGLQRCGDGIGLLRSLAVRADARGHGLGHDLCATIEGHAVRLGMTRLFLLSTGAAGYFARLGYRRTERDQAPAAIRATAQYGNLCPASAVLMTRDLAITSTGDPMDTVSHDERRQQVRDAYGAIAQNNGCGCGPSCCTPSDESVAELLSQGIGYSAEETAAVPEGANLGLGCGNPQAIAALKVGETVLDLGSGAGFDCFLAARAVGPSGRVIGVDMTPDMVSKARTNAAKGGYATVEFRLGEIEHLPVADASVDVIISNCVINLSPDKGQVFRDAYRALKRGGRLAISDIVLTAELPEDMKAEVALYTGCVAGAVGVAELTGFMAAAGFTAIRIAPKDTSREYIQQWAPGRGVEHYIASANIEAIKE